MIPPYPIIIVTYVDSCLGLDQSSRIEHPVEVIATGFVIYEDDESITLCAELIRDEYRGQVAIPKMTIRERSNL